MSKARTPFDILGVTPADEMTTIRMAWRAKVRRHHPDVAGNAPDATERLAEINAAFDALQGHVPSAEAKAAGAAEVARVVRKAKRAARAADKRRAEARRKAEAAAARQRTEALEAAKAEAIRARLEGHKGTIQAKAANGYARARRILAA